MGNWWRNSVRLFFFFDSKISADGDCSHEIKRCLLLGRKVMTNLDSIFKSRFITLPTKVHLVKAMVFPVVMYGWELDCQESWVPKNWCFWTVVLEKTLVSPLDCKEIKTGNPKGSESEMSPWFMSDSLWLHGLQPSSLLCPWDFPGKNTGVDCHLLLQGIVLIQGLNLCLLH